MRERGKILGKQREFSVDEVFLARTPLFKGSTPAEAKAMFGCLGAVSRHYGKGSYLLRMGDTTNALGLVLSGRVSIESIDVWGNVSVLGHVGPGQVFAETYAAVPDEPLMVNVVAVEDCAVLFLDVGRVLRTCPSACAHHTNVVNNLLGIFARKNLNLSRRVFLTAPKTIRGKLLSYLSFQASYQGSNEFEIPFNRQQLADYLGVDRSALSAELGRMQKEGMLETTRSRFRLNDGAL